MCCRRSRFSGIPHGALAAGRKQGSPVAADFGLRRGPDCTSRDRGQATRSDRLPHGVYGGDAVKDWRAIAQGCGFEILPSEIDRLIGPMDALEEAFRPLAANIPADLEPATTFHVDPEGQA